MAHNYPAQTPGHQWSTSSSSQVFRQATTSGQSSSHSAAADNESLCSQDIQVQRHATTQSEGSSEQRDVLLSVVWQGSQLAAAYYDLDCPQIAFMADQPELEDFAVLRNILRQVEPSAIILSSKQDERLLKVLKQSRGGEGIDSASEDDGDNKLLFLPSSDFGLEASKRRILSLPLPALPAHSTDTERSLYFSSLLPLHSYCVVKAIGGLLKYLDQARIGVELEEASVRVPILGFKAFTVEDQIIMDNTTFSALQIFHKEAHPSVYKFGTSSSSKEGLSLFGILNRCKSQIGSKKLRLWFLRPLKDLKALRQRLDTIAFLTQPRNAEVLSSLQSCLKNVKNVARILARMIEAQAMPADWMALYKTVYHALCIGQICRSQSQQHMDIFRKVASKFTADELHQIASILSKTVDFDASTANNRFMMKSGLDDTLDEKKRLYYGLPDLMTKVAREELSHLKNNIKSCNVIYMPQICYLLAIPKPEETDSDDYEIPGMQFMFESNNVLHYKSARTRELDNMLGDTLCDIKDIETSIMHKLQNTIVEHSPVLLDLMEYAAQLDCLQSLASCALEFGYVCPELTEDSVIDVKKGRHPLQELCCSPFIGNDIQAGGAHGKVKVLTGPNACGKSVYLKQVAVIVYMAHIGSFVPAESAVVGQIDHIFSRVKSLESVSVGLSTFMLDINQMADALNNATEKSLVVVDEFGKGTETVDGLSLLSASLRFWLKKGERSPHVFVSTHFHELVTQPLLPSSPLLRFMTMETLQEDGELVFLYHLTEGHTTSSYAAHTALQAGLPPDVVHRGRQVSSLLSQYKPVHPVDDSSTDTQFKRYEKIVERFLQLDLEKSDVKRFLQQYVLPVSKGQAAQ